MTRATISFILITLFAGTAAAQPSNQQLAQPALIENSYPLAGQADRANSLAVLQQITVDLIAIANQSKQAHWKVSGPLYFPLHEQFDAQVEL